MPLRNLNVNVLPSSLMVQLAGGAADQLCDVVRLEPHDAVM